MIGKRVYSLYNPSQDAGFSGYINLSWKETVETFEKMAMRGTVYSKC